MKPSDRILELLYDRREGTWGLEELARAAAIDRAGLGRALEAIRSSGQSVDFSPAEGVRLARPVRLAAALIERGLSVRRVGRSVVCFDEVESTNTVALSAIRQADADGLVVLAESQLRGRGRQGRQWISPPGRNVLLSVLLLGSAEGARPSPDARPAAFGQEGLTIAAGVAVAEAVEETTGLACGLKWPNDVLLYGAKLAGVLVETRREGATTGVVVGVGLNVNAAPAAGSIAQPAACMADHVGHPVERIEVVRSLLRHLDGWVERLADGRLDELHETFLARCRMINGRATVVAEGRRYAGRVLDVDPLRGLVLACDGGGTVQLPAGRSTLIGWEE